MATSVSRYHGEGRPLRCRAARWRVSVAATLVLCGPAVEAEPIRLSQPLWLDLEVYSVAITGGDVLKISGELGERDRV